MMTHTLCQRSHSNSYNSVGGASITAVNIVSFKVFYAVFSVYQSYYLVDMFRIVRIGAQIDEYETRKHVMVTSKASYIVIVTAHDHSHSTLSAILQYKKYFILAQTAYTEGYRRNC